MPVLPRGFSLRIFLPDGTPEGLRLVEKSNWIGRAVMCPRARFRESRSRPEFNRTGAYVLVGRTEEGALPTVYIGEGDPALPRLDRHFVEKDFWDTLVLFTSKDENLNKAHVQYLESRLVELARAARTSILDNVMIPQSPSLSEADAAEMEAFLDEMMHFFPLLNITAFNEPRPAAQGIKRYFLRARNIVAQGYEDARGFVVLANSEVARDVVPSAQNYLLSLREALLKQGVIAEQNGNLKLTQDYAFESPSTAAGVMLGRSTNGRELWKDENGRSLKENQAIAQSINVLG